MRKMKKLFIHCLLAHSLLLCFATLAFGADRLSTDEVQALKEIAKKLGKTDWNFSADPCSGESGWITQADRYFANKVTCGHCQASGDNDQICHVVSILLRAQNLPGTLPSEMAKLPYLQQIDLARNYLNGTVPPEWGSLPLINISLVANRLSGSIPVELANITTLKSLTMDYNSFSGGLPWELGFLPNLEILVLTSNNFTGELPDTFAKLTKLKDFRIIDNSFSGKIPSYIQNWTNIKKLGIMASGLTGPIPSGISLLTNLTDLRITDLNGPESSFPPLDNMKNLKILILRSCNINGELPDYFSGMTDLTTLDLSFNKLTGNVPRNFVAASNNLDYIFLTGNLLNGPEPLWMAGENVDLSYNNFTIPLGTVNCQPQAAWNLFAGSSEGNSSAASCLSNKTATCSKNWYTLNINCGGSRVTVDGTTYDEDIMANGPSTYYMSSTNWVSSSTGYFPDDDSSTDHFTWSNSSKLSMANPQLYTTARLSPISLTYYGFCLLNGNYTVSLHFAEIMFTNGPEYSSLGRRIFDVYIQGIRVLQNFNIADEAGGAGMAIIKNFTVAVTSSTLEIRLFWAGKGTTGIPRRGVYGPLISAISIGPDFEPPEEISSTSSSRSFSIGSVVGIVAASAVFVVLLVFGFLWWRGYLRRERTLEQDLKGVDLQTGKFSLRQIKDATKNFYIANKIGEGGFGPVYKGRLYDGTIIAVKQLSAKSKQGNREFVNEIGMISALQHPHLVKLYGCCIEGNQLLLVYEYMENNSVGRALFDAKESKLKLDWPTRHKICVGIAKGLAYLHEESRLKIVHRDIKATNVLLDKNLNPKISDFGLAKLDEDDSTHISTRIAGTYGYMAPEYAMRGYLTDKADVYSFGILVLEMVCGRRNTTYRSKEESFYILDWALDLQEKSSLLDLVDPRLKSDFNKEEMMDTINVALLCCNVTATLRPAMSSVVSMLEGRTRVEDLIIDTSASSHENEERRKHFGSLYSTETTNGSTDVHGRGVELSNISSGSPVSHKSSFRLLQDSNSKP